MTHIDGRRARLGMTLFALALGALALLAMPGLAAAKARDRNHDHIPDRWEKRHHLSLKVNQARKDQDHDGLRNRAEFLAGDNPRNADTNGDGVPDGEENAGTIASFDEGTGKLTIDLFGGESLSGFVTEETEIECNGSGNAAASASSEDEAGEEQGGEDGGEGQAGDEEGNDAEETGDDENEQEEEAGGEGGGSEEGSQQGNCTTAALVPGAVVGEAELKVANGKATFEKVELSGKEA